MIDPQTIEDLADRGIEIRLSRSPVMDMKRWIVMGPSGVRERHEYFWDAVEAAERYAGEWR